MRISFIPPRRSSVVENVIKCAKNVNDLETSRLRITLVFPGSDGYTGRTNLMRIIEVSRFTGSLVQVSNCLRISCIWSLCAPCFSVSKSIPQLNVHTLSSRTQQQLVRDPACLCFLFSGVCFCFLSSHFTGPYRKEVNKPKQVYEYKAHPHIIADLKQTIHL